MLLIFFTLYLRSVFRRTGEVTLSRIKVMCWESLLRWNQINYEIDALRNAATLVKRKDFEARSSTWQSGQHLIIWDLQTLLFLACANIGLYIEILYKNSHSFNRPPDCVVLFSSLSLKLYYTQNIKAWEIFPKLADNINPLINWLCLFLSLILRRFVCLSAFISRQGTSKLFIWLLWNLIRLSNKFVRNPVGNQRVIGFQGTEVRRRQIRTPSHRLPL